MNKTDYLPLLPLRDIVVFPSMIVPLFVGKSPFLGPIPIQCPNSAFKPFKEGDPAHMIPFSLG